MLIVHAAGNRPTVLAEIDVLIVDFIDDAEGKLVHTNLLIEIAMKHLGSPHHGERTVTFFTEAITIGFGRIKHRVYKARILATVDAETRAVDQTNFFCHIFGTSMFFSMFIHAMGLFDMLCSFVGHF
jgi:hypothetical protein